MYYTNSNNDDDDDDDDDDGGGDNSYMEWDVWMFSNLQLLPIIVCR